MKTKTFLTLAITFCVATAYCQPETANLQVLRNQILEEGLFLFRLEKASWAATDVLVKDYSGVLNQIVGYLSYPEGDHTSTIFWDKDEKILLSVTYDSTGTERRRIDVIRAPTESEANLIKLRSVAWDLVERNDEGFFMHYKNTSPNLIPIIRGNERIVFILTGSKENKLLIGNDYKLSLNSDNAVIKKEKLHNSLITLEQDEISPGAVGSTHSHVLENQPYMTSTDICTFMLYRSVFKLKNHVVISKKGTSIFEADKVRLLIVPQDFSQKR